MVEPTYQLDADGKESQWTQQLATTSEIAHMWPSETAIIDGRTSTGVFLSSAFGFALKEDPRDLRKYLDRYVRSGSKFAVIYQFLQDDGISHCAVFSDKPLVFGQNYTVQKLRRSAVGKSKK